MILILKRSFLVFRLSLLPHNASLKQKQVWIPMSPARPGMDFGETAEKSDLIFCAA